MTESQLQTRAALESKMEQAFTLQEKGVRGVDGTDEARRLFEEIVEACSAEPAMDPAQSISLAARCNLANLLHYMGETRTASKIYEEVIEGYTTEFGADSIDTMDAKLNYALLLDETSSDKQAALEYLAEVEEGYVRHLGRSVGTRCFQALDLV